MSLSSAQLVLAQSKRMSPLRSSRRSGFSKLSELSAFSSRGACVMTCGDLDAAGDGCRRRSRRRLLRGLPGPGVDGAPATQSRNLFPASATVQARPVSTSTPAATAVAVIRAVRRLRARLSSGPGGRVPYRIVHDEPDLPALPEQLRPLMARCPAAVPEERAGLAEIIAWCRQRLGADADAGAGPAVWRDVMGP
ncbi:hypothetical protein ACIP4U_26385 [Streptomyces caelestis]|uniref:hypothetical protein n=1 Tax=Streptomyces caelestis TaxID=36816 RepID=UPI003805914B